MDLWYSFLLEEVHAHRQTRARAYRAGRRCMRVFAESRYSQSHRPDVTIATDEAEEREREVSEEPEGKVAGDLRRWSRGLDERNEEEEEEENEETTRGKDTRMSIGRAAGRFNAGSPRHW